MIIQQRVYSIASIIPLWCISQQHLYSLKIAGRMLGAGNIRPVWRVDLPTVCDGPKGVAVPAANRSAHYRRP